MSPFAPPRACPDCGRASVAGTCPIHGSRPFSRTNRWDLGRPPVVRLRGWKLTQARRRLFARRPLCEMCEAKSPAIYTAAEIRDHRVPLAEGGDESPENEQALCKRCHFEKTETEKRRGLQRHALPKR